MFNNLAITPEELPTFYLHSNIETFFNHEFDCDLAYSIEGSATSNDHPDSGTMAIFKVSIINFSEARARGSDLLELCGAFEFTNEIDGCLERLFNLDEKKLNTKLQGFIKANITSKCPGQPNILLLESLCIDPKYRGQGIGISILKAMIRRFRLGTHIVLLDPCPLQYLNFAGYTKYPDERSQLNALWAAHKNQDKGYQVDSEKLMGLYGQIGFVPLPDTQYMIRAPYLQIE